MRLNLTSFKKFQTAIKSYVPKFILTNFNPSTFFSMFSFCLACVTYCYIICIAPNFLHKYLDMDWTGVLVYDLYHHHHILTTILQKKTGLIITNPWKHFQVFFIMLQILFKQYFYFTLNTQHVLTKVHYILIVVGLGSQKTDKEWMLYSEGPGYDSTLRSTWDGVHKSSQTSQNEVTHSMRFGKGRIGLSIQFTFVSICDTVQICNASNVMMGIILRKLLHQMIN